MVVYFQIFTLKNQTLCIMKTVSPELTKSKIEIPAPKHQTERKTTAELLECIRVAAHSRWKKKGKHSLLMYNVRVDNDGKIMHRFGNASANDIHPHSGNVYRIQKSMALNSMMMLCAKVPNTALVISIGDALQRIVTMIESGELEKRSDVKTVFLLKKRSGVEQYRITVDHTSKFFAVYLTNTVGHYVFAKDDGIFVLDNPPPEE